MSTHAPTQKRQHDDTTPSVRGTGRQVPVAGVGLPLFMQAKSRASVAAATLQRKCACTSAPGGNVACEACNGGKPLQTKLSIGASDDPLEQEADRVADQVLAMPANPIAGVAPPRIQRYTGQSTGEMGAAPASVDRVLADSGKPLDPALRQDMEQRFGHDFSRVRVHSGSAAEQSAHDVNAHAYTAGDNVVFGAGQYSPETNEGLRLIAHELTHVVQQRASTVQSAADLREVGADTLVKAETQTAFRASSMLLRQPSGGSGSRAIRPPHITQVQVNQTTPQQVTATFSDGRTESGACSTGKGHCCFDDTAGTAEGGACSAARSTQVGNNCTPVGDFAVTAKVPVTGGGVRLWTQFHDAKSVALHEYSPVDGTPLSHGCVRMHTQMAQTIFDGARVGVTRVRVEGLARPRCENSALQNEWSGDFTSAGSTPPDGQTIDPMLGRRPTQAEIAREQRHIRGARREMRSALGVDDAGLNAELAVVQGGAPIASRIPRCVPALTTEEQGISSAQSAGFLNPGISATSATFTAALNRARTEARAERIVRQIGEQLWQDATASARAGGAGTDDRQLYWTRIMLTTALRQWNPSWVPNADSLRRLHVRLLSLLELTSRGMTASTFPTGSPDLKRILISGFDPFGFPNAGDIRQSNLSGAATLALDGETLVQGTVSARVEGVVFPVRYVDFNDGIVENHLRPHLTGPQPPRLVMSISQGGSQFELEEWAGRRRSTDTFLDNVGRTSGGTPASPIEPPGLASGAEFLPHTVPPAMLGAMRGAEGRTSPIPEETTVVDLTSGSLPGGPGANPGRAVEGSGGGFLSNEIFYRNSLLRTSTGSSVPVIHLHTPRLAPGANDTTRNSLIARIRAILQATLPHL